MFDSAEIRIHPTGSIIARMGTKSQGQGHETTYAQIIATELGIPADDIMIEEVTDPVEIARFKKQDAQAGFGDRPEFPAYLDIVRECFRAPEHKV